ncbi:hypothetical protein Q9L42_011270 [Methylomarinum sp. Ch1-1]|uniref:Roadblock/LAMTOR2 domain-containing protein n=1 Tax=Methylomarinum roseum TaxID=3067653 RepID=A0AAU7NPR7_9GAMM|nr:hypothetical protein [Methylomarinum sp. Ch1-1]MDP4521121.1 hypothetical protein [Methylomarinum sp. Ch1-1]
MSAYKLVEGLFLLPTPSGAYYAIASNEEERARKFLRKLLQSAKTPELSIEQLLRLSDVDDEEKALELLHHCQKLGWVQGVDEALSPPAGVLEETLPDLLKHVSESGKVLLADDQGFYLASEGFAHETAEELSALSAEIATVHNRRSGLIRNNLGMASHAWAIVDAYGHSQIGFWPVFIGANRFVIAIAGIPHFNRAEFVNLIWALSIRYSGGMA